MGMHVKKWQESLEDTRQNFREEKTGTRRDVTWTAYVRCSSLTTLQGEWFGGMPLGYGATKNTKMDS